MVLIGGIWIGEGLRTSRARRIRRHYALTAFNLLLFHLNGPMRAMQLVVETCIGLANLFAIHR